MTDILEITKKMIEEYEKSGELNRSLLIFTLKARLQAQKEVYNSFKMGKHND